MKTTNRHDMTDELHDRLQQDLRALGDADPGEDFSGLVMARISGRTQTTKPRAAIVRLADWLTRPRTIRVSPLGGLAAAACILLAIGLAFRGGTPGEGQAPEGLSPVRFVLAAPGAREVAVIGSFNGWNAAGWAMRRDPASGVWTLATALPPGSHEYVFLVDGATPVPDATAALSADDGFGSRNSVIMVKGDDGSVL